MIAADPGQGGATWAVLQYLLGLRQLGHTVYLVEPVRPAKLQPEGTGLANSVNAAYFQSVVERSQLEDCAALLLTGTRETVGLPYAALRDATSHADLLINISGMLTDHDLLENIAVRVYLDLDPAFNQLWCAAEGIDVGFDGHTHFVTIGLAIGDPGCEIPTCGRQWIPTLQPIVLSEWPVADAVTLDAFTTIGNWRAYGSITHHGVFYGQKAHALRRFIGLPQKTANQFALALGIHPAETTDLTNLAANGWQLVDPSDVACDPDRYRAFIQGSKGELGVAKNGYATARCGWFSDRSVCYLASGRPVIALETGFSRFLPTGEGLFAFDTEDDVVEAADDIARGYTRHSRAARQLAEDFFDSAKVLPHLLERVGIDT